MAPLFGWPREADCKSAAGCNPALQSCGAV